MLGFLKRFISSYLRTIVSSTFREEIILILDQYLERKQKSGNALQVSQKILFNQYKINSNFPSYIDSGFSVFSQDNEDGILLEIFAKIGFENKKFVEIGAGNGILFSNCANLCINFGFTGLFIESNEQKVRDGISYYKDSYRTNLLPPSFCSLFVTQHNINDILSKYNLPNSIDLLSIDIDGNDFWVLQNLNTTIPRVIVLEINPAFGKRICTIKYDANFSLESLEDDNYGMSALAAIKLCKSKGYKLVACNSKGFNLIFVLDEISKKLPEMDHSLIFEKDYFKSKVNTSGLEESQIVQV